MLYNKKRPVIITGTITNILMYKKSNRSCHSNYFSGKYKELENVAKSFKFYLYTTFMLSQKITKSIKKYTFSVKKYTFSVKKVFILCIKVNKMNTFLVQNMHSDLD